jgi:O-antigen/teichoic acid export membrane protein
MAENTDAALRTQLVRGSAVMILGRGIGLVAGLAVSVLLARLLGPAGYGVYALALSVVALLTVPAELGLPTLAIREVAVAIEQRNWGLLRGMTLWSQRVVLATSVAVGLATAAVAYLWRADFAADFPLTLALAMVYFVVSSYSGLIQGFLQGVREFALALLPDLLALPTVFAACLALLVLVFGKALTPQLAMGVYASCGVLSLLAVLIAARVKLPAQARTAQPVVYGGQWLSGALPLCLTAGLTLVNSQLVVVLIGCLSSTRDVGLYRVAASGAGMAVIVGATLGGVVGPYIAAFHERGDVIRLGKLATYSAWVGALPAVALLALYALAGERLLHLVFGAAFVPALPALVLLTVGQTVNAATGVVQVLLNMTGHGRDTLRGVGLGAVTSALLCAALIPGFGVNGAAVASTAGIIAQSLYLVARVRLRLNIDSTILRRSLGSAV